MASLASLCFVGHMVAYGQDELQEVRQVAILKSSLGAEGYKISMVLCQDEVVTLDVVLERLTNRFAPIVSKIYACSVFHRRYQLQGETCIQFVSVLRQLMSKCDYVDEFKVELLRDRFVAGCSSDKIREPLMLENDDMTLDQALVIANNCERVAVESKSVVSGTQVDDSSVLRVTAKQHLNRSKSVGKGACFSCGKLGHHKGDLKCPASGRKCNICKGEGHFAACCKRKQQGNSWNRRTSSYASSGQSTGQRSSAGNSVQVGVVDAYVDAVNRPCGKCKAVECTVNGENVCLVCDTGARVSILNESTVTRLQLTVIRPDVDVSLKTYTGAVVNTLGVVRAAVQCSSRHVANFTFVVVKTGANIMGLDLFEALGYSIDIPSCHNADSCMQCQCNRVEASVFEHRFKTEFAELFNPPEIIVGFVHKPKVDSSVVPRGQALRRVPIALQGEVIQELNRMVDEGM